MRGPTVANPTLERSRSTTAVVTPQAVLLEFRTAGIGSRVLAKVIDLFIQFVMLLVVSILSAIAPGSGALIIGVVGTFIVIFVYPLLEAVMNGQTLGKRALSIRVITTAGGPVRFRHAAVRSLIGALEILLLPPGGPVALISALLSRRSQRVGDLVAETLVVRDRPDITQPVFFNPPPGAEQLALTLDTTRLTHPQFGLLRQFVLRSAEMAPDSRDALAVDLCEKLRSVLLVRPPQVDPALFVAAVVFAHQRRFSAMTVPVAPPGSRTLPPPQMPSPMGPAVYLPPPTRY